MKRFIILLAALFCTAYLLFAEEPENKTTPNGPSSDQINPAEGSFPQNSTDFNKQSPLLIPIAEIPLTNGLLWSYDRYISDAPFSHISGQTIRNNFANGWVWDTDDFPTNFSLHPYLGSVYYNCARSNGYGFYSSAPFAFGGSLMWEMFMENTKPSYNDLVNTTVSGILLGEIQFRLSSNILDDHKTGGQRALREITAAIIDPARGFNRLVQGKMFQTTGRELYQKEPLHGSIALGARRTFNNAALHLHDATNGTVSLNLFYGDPYEVRSRKPFDYFKTRADLSSGDLKHIAHSVLGDALLFGRNTSDKALFGVFQHYDYWNTDAFEIGTIGLSGGMVSRIPVFGKGTLQNDLHLAAVPLGASNARKFFSGEMNPGFQNYTYSGGAEFKYGTQLNIKWCKIGADYYLYWLHTYVGKPGDNLIGIFRPRISFKLYRAMNLGYEYFLYKRRDTNGQGPTLRATTHETRAYLFLDFE